MSLPGAGPAGWEPLSAVIRTCTRCEELAATRYTVVPGEAPAGADLLLVGEAPGAAEDASGRPFVGRSGELLDALLARAGLDRGRVAVSNAVKCRPPGNRTPRRAELTNCRPWLEQQIDLVAPRVVVALGSTATQWFFGPSARLGALREQDPPPRFADRPVITTYHPSAAIRFGPRGAPRAALQADLVRAAALVAASA